MAMAVRTPLDTPETQRYACPSKSRPIDLVHLANQTMGDKALETEILQMFARQARGTLHEMVDADAPRMVALAHRLKGSARAVGAFNVATVAERMEASPADAAAHALLHAAVVEAENFITGLCR